jgi:hypothetical protein
MSELAPGRGPEPAWSRLLASHRHQSGLVVIAGMAILAHAELANHGEVATQVAALVGSVLGALAWRRRGESVAQATPRPLAQAAPPHQPGA